MSLIPQVRSFNRTVTQRVGALEGDYLGSHRSLGACRLLFEIGLAGAEVRELRARLGLDSGYLSRMLRGLEAEGLLSTVASKDDSRVRLAVLTAKGRKEYQRLDQRSDQIAREILAQLPPAQQETLVASMRTVERLLLAGAVEVHTEKPSTAAARYCLEQYFDELRRRFEFGFDPARSIHATVDDFAPPKGHFVVARLHGNPIGCGALIWHHDYAYLKRMWVAESSRGLGVGSRILQALEDLAARGGQRVVRLETNKALVEAQGLYRRSGYREVRPFNDEPYANHWFEKKLPARSTSRPAARKPSRRPS